MKELSFYIITHEDLYTFTDTLLGLLTEHDLSATDIPAFIAPVNNSFADFDKSLKRDLSNNLTPLVREADSNRDRCFIGFRMYVEAAGYRLAEGWKEASGRILRVIHRYGSDAYKAGYAEETAAIKNMITDLTEPSLAADVQLIEATPWLNALDTSQNTFDGVWAQLMSQQQEEILPLEDSRKALVKDLRNLLSMIGLRATISDNEALQALTASIDQLISNSMATARAQQARKG